MIVYFKRHRKRLPIVFNPEIQGDKAWIPGDLLFMVFDFKQTRPHHVGLVSPYTLFSGDPMVTNNLATYFNTADVDFMGTVPMMYRFRF